MSTNTIQIVLGWSVKWLCPLEIRLNSSPCWTKPPLAIHLPLDVVRDLYATDTASPAVVAGDVASAGVSPLVFYGVPDATPIKLTRMTIQ